MDANTEASIITIQQVSAGLQQRTICKTTAETYISKMRMIGRILAKNKHCLSEEAFVLNDDGSIKLNEEFGFNELKLPMSAAVGTTLFALISVDDTLPQRSVAKRKQSEMNGSPTILEALEVSISSTATSSSFVDLTNPGKDLVTISSGCMKGYRSALKWWHRYENFNYGKYRFEFSTELDNALQNTLASYKRDVADKKTRGNV